MYQKPQEYIQELKQRIEELKAELAELEPIYEAMIKVGVTKPSAETSVNFQNNFICRALSPAQKIAEAQRARHRRNRDKKVPKIVNCLKAHGPSSLASMARELRMTSAAVKKIVEENVEIFKKNRNQLW